MSPQQILTPTVQTRGVARKMVATAHKPGATAEAILHHLAHIHPDQRLALVVQLAKLAAGCGLTRVEQERMQLEEAAYSDDDARRAASAWARGERDPWTRTGRRVYNRRKQRGYRAREDGAA